MNNIETHIKELIKKNESLTKLYKPIFLRLYKSEDKEQFLTILETPGITINDTLFGQMQELIKIKHPTKKLSNDELSHEVMRHISPLTIMEYGVWVYYPWSNRLIHIPDEKEFIEIRTSRNQYKITKEERDIFPLASQFHLHWHLNVSVENLD